MGKGGEEMLETLYYITIVDSERKTDHVFIEAGTKDSAVKQAYKENSPCLVMNVEEIF